MSELEDVLYRLGKVLLAPREAFDTHIAERYSSYLPLALYVGVNFSLSALAVKGLLSLIGQVPLYNLGWLLELVANLAGVLGVASGLVDLLMHSSLIHITARLMGYDEGRWDDLVGLVAFSSAPLVFPTALAAVGYLVSHVLLLVSLVLVIPFALWSLYLMVVATSVNYGMTTGSAIVASVVGPLVAMLVAVLLTAKLGPVGLLITIVGIAVVYLEGRSRR